MIEQLVRDRVLPKSDRARGDRGVPGETGLPRLWSTGITERGEAIALRGRMDLAAYDRLFPSQDVLPVSGGIGNLIAAPLQGRSRRHGATVFLDLATLEPHADQWSYLASLHRLSPREVERFAGRVAPPRTGGAVTRLAPATASGIHPRPAAVVSVHIAAGVAVDMAELTPALLATLKHAASMP